MKAWERRGLGKTTIEGGGTEGFSFSAIAGRYVIDGT